MKRECDKRILDRINKALAANGCLAATAIYRYKDEYDLIYDNDPDTSPCYETITKKRFFELLEQGAKA